MRLLVTGSRTWTDWRFIHRTLGAELPSHAGEALCLVHGGARGADEIAEQWALMTGTHIELHAADWKQHGKAAGHIRNAEMVKLGADLCLAFIRDCSRGATHCAGLAEKAGIPTRIYRWENLP